VTKTELLDIIRNGEHSGVEFKRDTIDNRVLAKELVAFANLRGGIVLLGVEDDGTITGLTRYELADPNDLTSTRNYQKLEEWVMQACRDKIRPEIVPYFQVLHDLDLGKDVGIVQVSRGWGVHHVWHDQHYTPYIRVGSICREMSLEERERLYQQRGAFRLELRPVSGSGLDDLDRRRLRDYFGRIRQQLPDPDDDESWKRLLVNTEIMVDESGARPVVVAGLLLFGKNPNRFLPHAGIDAVAYPGIEKDYTAKERAALRGPMTPLLGEDGLVENGLVEQAVDFVRRNSTVEAALNDGARRVEHWTYPVDVIREAVVNALVHRDYLLSSTDIELSVYADRLEVISPGRLPNGITPERMKTGCRAARNQILKDTMRDYGYLEHMGMGIPRKIVKGMRDHNGTEPDLIEDAEQFILRLWNEKKS
jgi:ATP-dependent DNA helicase RecG